jgi:hypothetical protein
MASEGIAGTNGIRMDDRDKWMIKQLINFG